MADNGKWYKLWIAALTDPDLLDLDIADFGRWVKFGLYLKAHGNNGKISLTSPSRVLCLMLQVDDFNSLIITLKTFPNITVTNTVTDVTNKTVTYTIRYKNWLKYQGDSSIERVKRFREKNKKTPLHLDDSVTAQEEKRREEKIKEKKEIKKKESFKFILPSWIEKETWDNYLEMRRKIKAPMTENAKKLAVGVLEKLKTEGSDVNQVLKKSTWNSWRGLFPLDGDSQQSNLEDGAW